MHDEIEEFLDILEGQDKTEGTINEYRKGLTQFSAWLESEELAPKDVTPRDLQRYLAYLKGTKGYAPKTIRVRFVGVRRFYADWCANDGPDTNPASNVSVTDYAPKQTRKEEATKERREWLSKDEVTALVESVPSPTIRNRLVVLFQYYTGLRRQEVCDVKLSDLDRENRQVQVRGKGSKTHTAHWQPRLDTLLTTWIDSGYRNGSPYAEESPYLFVSNAGPQLSGSRLNDIIKEAAENAGIQEVLYEDAAGRNHYKVTSHILRHSFAMHYLENGGSIEGLSKLLAHSSVTTTEIYGEILDERAGEEYEKFAPSIDI